MFHCPSGLICKAIGSDCSRLPERSCYCPMDEKSHRPRAEDEDSSGIFLGRMRQQEETRAPDDDWTGVADATERRRLQNRLNQRIYRRRRRNPPSLTISSAESISAAVVAHAQRSADRNSGDATISSRAEHGTNHALNSSIKPSGEKILAMNAVCIHSLAPKELREMMDQYEKSARRDYELGSPRVDQLLTLIQFNVFRALLNNTTTLGFTMAWLEYEAISPWNTNFQRASSSCPPSLLPTPIQRTVPHHPWIDLWPIPQMRDNILLAGDAYDEDQLCKDLVDFCNVPHAQTGLVVWREAWDQYGWEASEAFVRNWGWILKGCTELIESTNYWRAKRGEKALALKE